MFKIKNATSISNISKSLTFFFKSENFAHTWSCQSRQRDTILGVIKLQKHVGLYLLYKYFSALKLNFKIISIMIV